MWPTTEKLPCFSCPSSNICFERQFKRRILTGGADTPIRHTSNKQIASCRVPLLLRQQRWWTRNCCIYALYHQKLPKLMRSGATNLPWSYFNWYTCIVSFFCKIRFSAYFHFHRFANLLEMKLQNCTLLIFQGPQKKHTPPVDQSFNCSFFVAKMNL